MRASGILMPVFSLPSKYGIGTFGKEAYNFVDFLKKSGQTYWQVLPFGITGFGNSPYQCFSSYAGNPFFIDLELLCEQRLLTVDEIEKYNWGESSSNVDYDILSENRDKALHKAVERFKENIPDDYYDFEQANAYWLDDFSLYFAIKQHQSNVPFDEFDAELKLRDADALEKARKDFANDIFYHKAVQFFFSKQWAELKEYANLNGIYIIGDIPIYVAYDSADVWSEPKQFLLDKNLKPKAVSGCPPDAFSSDGQLWGNPLYDWKYMKKCGYDWWLKRIEYNSRLFDVVRIDHFRAFSAYYSIPYGDKTAKNGKWVKGPGKSLFQQINKNLGEIDIIAEDLGTIDDEVRKLLSYTGYPGMKVLQFAFDPNEESLYLPHNIGKHCVVYTGTHDNDTAIGYLNTAPKENVEFMKSYLCIGDNESFNWSLIKSAMKTSADTVILQMQDFLGLDNSARINTPSTTKNNWQWRIDKSCLNDWLAKLIFDCTKTYSRLPKSQNNISKNCRKEEKIQS